MKERILITSALPYANGPLHFGHIAGAYLPADCYARFQRLLKNEVLFICGSDEYGIAITLSAEMAGRTPKEHVDIFHEVNQDLFKKLHISFDHYSRTTTDTHVQPTQEFFINLLENGFIEAKITEQLYSVQDNKFLADRYVMGTCPKCGFLEARGDECPSCGASYEATDLKNPRSKLTQSPLELRETKHWFLRLDLLKEKLQNWLAEKTWKPNVVNFIKNYIEDLRPRAITRDSTWGIPIPLPDTEGKVLYVWFDAPIGYLSFTKEWAKKNGTPDKWKDFWQDSETRLVNFIGKDNIPFHAAVFPAMLMGQKTYFKTVDDLPANEFLNLEGRQFSKSDGWTIDLEDFFKKYSTDQIRYAIAANAPETADAEFTWKEFQIRCNSELLGKYGNFVNRVLVFAQNQVDAQMPALSDLDAEDLEFLAQIQSIAEQIKEAYSTYRLRKASGLIMELAQLGNVYFDHKKPWSLAKQIESKQKMRNVIGCCLEAIKALSAISFPIIPGTAQKIWHMLGFVDPLNEKSWSGILSEPIQAGQKLHKPEILFRRVEDSEIEEEIKKLHHLHTNAQKKKAVAPSPASELKPPIVFEDFKAIDLRVGQILTAEKLPKSKKLLKLTVDIGKEKRTIVSGIAHCYEPEQLLGKKVAVVVNLPPATLMGVESFGMILASGQGDHLKVIFCEGSPGDCIS